MKNIAIILAGGSGSRFNNSTPKQFLYLNDKRIIDYSISTFNNHSDIDDIIIVCHNKWKQTMESEYPYIIISGGKTRQESSFLGLKACPQDTSNVLIHDAARPFISNEVISNAINCLKKYEAINISTPVLDTTVVVKNNIVDSIPNRKNIFLSKTPQAFRYSTILNAHKSANDKNSTDDIQLVKNVGIDCYNMPSNINNIKITYKDDLDLARLILKNNMEK